ncbi:hypothetical protein Cni_G23098 [Canna indica]|uniref:Uncharacterized protein n=1 Tax=Canna indica TaxID=4628 RepID=A0AAQ3KWF1_9LILI|nr:hypothetical protein Cni_G23098 [Canna indica]
MEVSHQVFFSFKARRTNPCQLRQAAAEEMHLLEGGLLLHPSLPLRSHLLLQRGVPSRRPAAEELQLPAVQVLRRAAVREGDGGGGGEHEKLRGGEAGVQGEVADGRHPDAEVRGGRGGHDAAEEEEPDGVHQEEECREEEEAWAEPSQ